MKILRNTVFLLVAVLLAGCASKQAPYDYSAYKKSNPKSIIVLQPINKSTEIKAPYSILANVTKPLSEAGYYVFPVVLVEETFKNNGLTVAEDIHNVPAGKIKEIFGADAAMYIEIEEYGTSYSIISSDTVVAVKAKLVDLSSKEILWEGKARAASSEQSSSNSNSGIVGLLVEAAVKQIMETAMDTGFQISTIATSRLLSPVAQNGILYGPRSPLHGKETQIK